MAGKRNTLDPDRMSAHLGTRWLGREVVVYESTASTNDVAMACARQSACHGLVVLAEQQTAGRGRGANTWRSTPGDSVLASVVVIDSEQGPELMSLAAAVAVAEAIGEMARVKWPNDVLIRGKKVCGILLETKSFARHQATVIGIGINCHQRREDFPPELGDSATSVDMETGGRTDREGLVRRVLVNLEDWLGTTAVQKSRLVDQWIRLSDQVGRRVTLAHDGRQYSGVCLGVDPEQGLIVQLDGGGVRYFAAPQTHVVR